MEYYFNMTWVVLVQLIFHLVLFQFHFAFGMMLLMSSYTAYLTAVNMERIPNNNFEANVSVHVFLEYNMFKANLFLSGIYELYIYGLCFKKYIADRLSFPTNIY